MTTDRLRAFSPFSVLSNAARDASGRAGRRRSVALMAALALAGLVLGGAPAVAQQAPAQLVLWDDDEKIGAPPDVRISVRASSLFHYSGQNNAGTNPVLTDADFSTMDYYVEVDTGVENGILYVKAKTEEALNALASPPPSPFTVTADVTMENDEGDSATATVTFSTGYNKSSP